MYDGILKKYRPDLAAVGVGLSFNERTVVSQDGSTMVKDGFTLQGAAGAAEAAVSAPVVAIPMTRDDGAADMNPLAAEKTATQRLVELKGMLDAGLIDEGEFAAKKKGILSSL